MRANDFGTGVGIMGKGVINPLVFLFAAGIDMIMRPVCGADRPALHHKKRGPHVGNYTNHC